MDCPYCSQPGARRVLFKVRCPNAACPAYDAAMSGGRGRSAAGRLSDASAPGNSAPSSRFPLDPFGLVLELGGIALIVLWALGRSPWGLAAGIALVVAGTVLTVLRLFRRRTATDPKAVPAQAAAWSRNSALSWVLWVAAYGLFRYGQAGGKAKPILWALAAFVAIAAYVTGRRAESSGAASARDDDEDEELDELRRAERDEREGPFDPTGTRRLEVHYRTAKGEDKTFIGDRESLRRRRAHVTVRVAPEGIRIALRADRIANRAEVEGAIPA